MTGLTSLVLIFRYGNSLSVTSIGSFDNIFGKGIANYRPFE